MALTHAAKETAKGGTQSLWRPPGIKEIWRQPLPHLRLFDRALTRACSVAALPRFTSIAGLEHIAPERDPFILALNHATRFEALALPALLVFHRRGKLVHFFADWNFQMIPGVGLLYRRSGAIVLTRKSARPRILNALKPFYTHATSGMDRAKAHLAAGRSIAIFPEGTVNRDPARLLRGRLGAARLSLETGVPILPAGLRVTGGTSNSPFLSLVFGEALVPATAQTGGAARVVSSSDVRDWHSVIMFEIARLSGKSWQSTRQEPRHGAQ